MVLFRSGKGRPLRFAVCGATAALAQLGLLALLVHLGWNDILANGVALLVSAQLSFVLNRSVTWYDRRATGSLFYTWLRFLGSIAAMAVLNMGVFLVVRSVVPPVAASALGIGVGAIGNYTSGDRLVFRRRGGSEMSDADTADVA